MPSHSLAGLAFQPSKGATVISANNLDMAAIIREVSKAIFPVEVETMVAVIMVVAAVEALVGGSSAWLERAVLPEA